MVLIALPMIALKNAQVGGLVFTVDSVGDDDDAVAGDGFCATVGGQCTLRAAVQEANAHAGDDGIDFSISTSFSSPTITLTRALPDLSTALEIIGPGLNKLTVQRVMTGGTYPIFKVTTPGAVTLFGMTIRAGINVEGGGISNSSTGTVNVINCAVSENLGSYGGGINNFTTGTVNVANCTLSDNSAAGHGGGITNYTGTVNVTNCTFSENTARTVGVPGGRGGAFFILGGTVNVTNSTLSGNNAVSENGFGGGFYIDGATVNITNCTLSGNSAEMDGGAIFNTGGTVNLSNSTLSGNSAIFGGGFRNAASFGGGTTNVKSSLIALNTAINAGPDVHGDFTSQGFNLIGKNDGATATFPAGNPNANNDIVGTSASQIDPMLDPNGLQNNGGPNDTIALQSISPAIDKGTSNSLAGILTIDQRGVGFLRIIDDPSVANAIGGNGADVGAFEFGAHIDVVSRKLHGANPRDINLPLAGSAGIECRSGGAFGNHKVRMTFPTTVTVGGVSVTSSDGMATATPSVSGQVVTIDLYEVINAQTLIITLANLSDGTNTNDLSFSMSVLLGDTTGNGTVNASDVSQTKAKSGQAVGTTNFRTDVTVSNSINSSDFSMVKSKSGTALP